MSDKKMKETAIALYKTFRKKKDEFFSQKIMKFSSDKCDFDESKRMYSNFSSDVQFQSKTDMKEEIPTLRDNLEFNIVNKDTVARMVRKIPLLTFETAFESTKIQSGQRSIMFEVSDIDDDGDLVSMKEIRAQLFVKKPKFGDSVEIDGVPR